MCTVITKYVKKPTPKVIKVWKVLGYNSTNFHWRPVIHDGIFPRGKWVTAIDRTYAFNCYKTKRAALGHSSRPVQCRARFVEGYGSFGGSIVVFAREIFVPKGRKKK